MKKDLEQPTDMSVYMKGKNLFSEHPRKLLKPQIGVTYKDKSGCELGGTLYSENPARKTMTRLEYQSLEVIQRRPSAGRSGGRTALEKYIKDGQNLDLLNQNELESLHIRRASATTTLDRKNSNLLLSRSSNREGPVRVDSKLQMYNIDLYKTSTAKFSTNLTTSLGLTRINKKRVNSEVAKYISRDAENRKGTKVLNFKRGLPLGSGNNSAIVQLNMSILNDSKWGENKPGFMKQNQKKPPKYLPSMFRDSSIISGISEAGKLSTVTRSPKVRMRGSSMSTIHPLPPPPLGKTVGHGLFKNNE